MMNALGMNAWLFGKLNFGDRKLVESVREKLKQTIAPMVLAKELHAIFESIKLPFSHPCNFRMNPFVVLHLFACPGTLKGKNQQVTL